jgi:hypothetical protein
LSGIRISSGDEDLLLLAFDFLVLIAGCGWCSYFDTGCSFASEFSRRIPSQRPFRVLQK